jgi:hypothetical protein
MPMSHANSRFAGGAAREQQCLRTGRIGLAGAFCLLGLLSCAKGPVLPVGRWEGVYEAQDVMVAVRFEITPRGDFVLSAPDATDIENLSAGARTGLHRQLAETLAATWPQTRPRPLNFDGRLFRKPGAVAPQLEWDADKERMTAILYLGLHAPLRVDLHATPRFTHDPWKDGG